jgi:hypothetical protein
MAYLDTTLADPDATDDCHVATSSDVRRAPVAVVVEDGKALSDAFRQILDFLAIGLERVACDGPLLPVLRRHQPMAVIAAMDAQGQDGAHVLKTVADYDSSLPVLLLIDRDPVLSGAAEAVADLWGLSGVTQTASWPSAGEIVEFLCRAGQRGDCLALLPA